MQNLIGWILIIAGILSFLLHWGKQINLDDVLRIDLLQVSIPYGILALIAILIGLWLTITEKSE